MSDTDATPPPSEAVELVFDLPHPPQKVWRALTDPVLLGQWLLPIAGFEPDAGATFTFRAPPQPGWDGIVNCRIVAIEPHRKISWTWVVGDLDTLVTFTLTPTESGTRLSLVHSGFKPDQKRNFAGARYGWKMMGGRLVDLLASV